MKIFIGSSTEQKKVARDYADQLRLNDFEVIPWYEPGVFPASSITIDRLSELSRICDGGVFLFFKDDRLYKGKRKKRKEKMDFTTRANVVMEYGMFVASCGILNSVMILETGVTPPTDTSGVTYLNKEECPDAIVRHFKMQRDNRSSSLDENCVTVYMNSAGKVASAEQIPSDWVSRKLYVGREAAQCWRDVENDPAYTGSKGLGIVQKAIRKLLHGHPSVDTLISLGPGVGSMDDNLLPSINPGYVKAYVPVDINFELLSEAVRRIDGSNAKTGVPFAILADIEQEMSFVSRLVGGRTSTGRLYLMLGGTFSNIESTESAFLSGIKSALRVGDLFLLDVFVFASDYSPANDPVQDVPNLPDTVQRFLKQGVRRTSKIDNSLVDELISVTFDSAPSSLSKTKSVTFCDKRTKTPIIFVRRYEYSELTSFLSELGFTIKGSEEVVIPNSNVNRALFLLGVA